MSKSFNEDLLKAARDYDGYLASSHEEKLAYNLNLHKEYLTMDEENTTNYAPSSTASEEEIHAWAEHAVPFHFFAMIDGLGPNGLPDNTTAVQYAQAYIDGVDLYKHFTWSE